MKNNSKKYILVAIAVILILWAFVAFKRNDSSSTIAPVPVKNDAEKIEGIEAETVAISYVGEEGKTALELLQSKHQVDVTETEGVGEFVSAINGQAAGENEYWAFYINGELAPVGAGEYVTKEGDLIEWRLDSF